VDIARHAPSGLSPRPRVRHGKPLAFAMPGFPRATMRRQPFVLQTLYAWLMTFACLGMFRSLLTRENRTIRYLSDSTYWLYLAHLPLILVGQIMVQDWRLARLAKCVLLTVVVTGFLLLIYDKLVRYRWLGTLLNGPRSRPTHSATRRNGCAEPATPTGLPGSGDNWGAPR